MIPTPKKEIASQYLDDAIKCYEGGRYFSALTLAGAAEEILGKHLADGERALNLEAQSSLAFDNALRSKGIKEWLKSPGIAKLLGANGNDEWTEGSLKEIKDELNRPKNSAKHCDGPTDEAFNYDAKIAAGDIILRAIANFRRVFNHSIEGYQCEAESIRVDRLNQSSLLQHSKTGAE